MLFTFRYKPLGKVQTRMVEASDLEMAGEVAGEWCRKQGNGVTFIPHSVEPAMVATEAILTAEQVREIKERRAKRKVAADVQKEADARQAVAV